jgi:hypothetical protein
MRLQHPFDYLNHLDLTLGAVPKQQSHLSYFWIAIAGRVVLALLSINGLEGKDSPPICGAKSPHPIASQPYITEFYTISA